MTDIHERNKSPAAREFINCYRCPECGNEWEERWSAQCDTDCPICGHRHVSPYMSQNVEPEIEADPEDKVEAAITDIREELAQAVSDHFSAADRAYKEHYECADNVLSLLTTLGLTPAAIADIAAGRAVVVPPGYLRQIGYRAAQSPDAPKEG